MFYNLNTRQMVNARRRRHQGWEVICTPTRAAEAGVGPPRAGLATVARPNGQHDQPERRNLARLKACVDCLTTHRQYRHPPPPQPNWPFALGEQVTGRIDED